MLKQCLFCQVEFTTTGPNQKYCCKAHQYEHQKVLGIRKEYRDRANAKRGSVVGIGSGGLTGTGERNVRYTHGRWSFRNFARKLKEQGVPCNRCGKDLREAKRGEWCGHHKDHNPLNNSLHNLELLCKRCHQLHHETNFMKVQRLSREGVESSALEAPNIP